MAGSRSLSFRVGTARQDAQCLGCGHIIASGSVVVRFGNYRPFHVDCARQYIRDRMRSLATTSSLIALRASQLIRSQVRNDR